MVNIWWIMKYFGAKRWQKLLGGNLLKQGKLSSPNRAVYFGYSRLESYFSNQKNDSNFFPSRISGKIQKYSRDKLIFFITGFHLANYSRRDLFDAKDLDAENRVDELLEAVEISKRYRTEWVEAIVRVAQENKDYLIVVKKHPIEKKDDYRNFANVDNILYIYEDIGIEDIISNVGIFFHYGSTSLVDSYLCRIPSIYVYSPKNKPWYSDLGWRSTRKVEVSQIPALVREYATVGIPFVKSEEIRIILKDVFNIEEGKPYSPSRDIAKLILDEEPAQRIPLTDFYFWKALFFIFYQTTRRHAIRMVKKIIGMDPDMPFRRNRTISCNGSK